MKSFEELLDSALDLKEMSEKFIEFAKSHGAKAKGELNEESSEDEIEEDYPSEEEEEYPEEMGEETPRMGKPRNLAIILAIKKKLDKKK